MFDLGWSEMLLIGIVALIVVGPKDLPVLFRNVGRFVGKAKGMAREFTSAMNEAADESGLREVSKGLKSATNPLGSALDGVKDAARDMTKGLDPSEPGTAGKSGKQAAESATKATKTQSVTAPANAVSKTPNTEGASDAKDGAKTAAATAAASQSEDIT
ncbi:Sec-independent protein translocase protein TatB [Pontibaca salina]|uniref:Sec-independent protein translocase protein TatB n=1 Tax=Pontibaca salina TaxID=2795731 RepID=A0A934HSY2_9RHOB|nr:Sec-independent protein translocase protein TatB [Pontibaca salina]MBI6630140.1 twin-arginine translocase subunit TatB [Pontibaca salina]